MRNKINRKEDWNRKVFPEKKMLLWLMPANPRKIWNGNSIVWKMEVFFYFLKNHISLLVRYCLANISIGKNITMSSIEATFFFFFFSIFARYGIILIPCNNKLAWIFGNSGKEQLTSGPIFIFVTHTQLNLNFIAFL